MSCLTLISSEVCNFCVQSQFSVTSDKFSNRNTKKLNITHQRWTTFK